jgi:hypothetical protein
LPGQKRKREAHAENSTEAAAQHHPSLRQEAIYPQREPCGCVSFTAYEHGGEQCC